jgi:hypothetical protein
LTLYRASRARAAVNHAVSGAGGVRMKLEGRAAAEHDTNQQALITEALNLLFEYGKSLLRLAI